MALSSTESDLYAAVKTASEGLGIQSFAKDLGISNGLNLHLDAQPQRVWAKRSTSTCRICGYRRLPNPAGSNMNPADLMTKPLTKPQIERFMGTMGDEFVEYDVDSRRVDRQERNDVFATWRPKKSGTLVASFVLRDQSVRNYSDFYC